MADKPYTKEMVEGPDSFVIRADATILNGLAMYINRKAGLGVSFDESNPINFTGQLETYLDGTDDAGRDAFKGHVAGFINHQDNGVAIVRRYMRQNGMSDLVTEHGDIATSLGIERENTDATGVFGAVANMADAGTGKWAKWQRDLEGKGTSLADYFGRAMRGDTLTMGAGVGLLTWLVSGDLKTGLMVTIITIAIGAIGGMTQGSHDRDADAAPVTGGQLMASLG